MLAGYELESGADRDELPGVSESGRAAAEAYARRCAVEDGVQLIDVAALDELINRSGRESVYFIDVRTSEEYDQGRIQGFGGSPVVSASNAATTWPW